MDVKIVKLAPMKIARFKTVSVTPEAGRSTSAQDSGKSKKEGEKDVKLASRGFRPDSS